jgi:hypothetical protein
MSVVALVVVVVVLFAAPLVVEVVAVVLLFAAPLVVEVAAAVLLFAAPLVVEVAAVLLFAATPLKPRPFRHVHEDSASDSARRVAFVAVSLVAPPSSPPSSSSSAVVSLEYSYVRASSGTPIARSASAWPVRLPT